MMIDVDWVYREFLRRGYRQDYASDFLDQAWKNSGKEVETHQQTEPDHKPLTRPEGGKTYDLQDMETFCALSASKAMEWAALQCQQKADHCDRREAEGSTPHAATTLRDVAEEILNGGEPQSHEGEKL